MKKGVFITFEGIDGCGKSTQMRLLGQRLEQRGVAVIYTREPGGTAISEKIRSVILDRDNTEMTAITEMLLYAAARAQHVEELVLPSVMSGKVVLCDRFYDSTVAYQGAGRSLSEDKLREANALAIKEMWPDLTIFLDVDYETSRRRMHKREALDRMDAEKRAFHERVIEGFRELADKYPERICRIDASGSKEETQARIRNMVQNHVLRCGESFPYDIITE